MASRVFSLRIDAQLWDRIREHAARRGMTAQDYVVATLVRDDFDERFKAAVEETERLYGGRGEPPAAAPPARTGGSGGAAQPPPYSSPSAGIR
ncbi:hypothetical protein [Streptomyces sp. NPDC020983]|uniref:hypothetical protein n=1 Tax=Streptomyces sp. NPDC020983 TaxID=3365106 RepID=UPI00379078EA